MKDCEKILEAMSLFIDNELDEESNQQFQSHIEQCPACKHELDRLFHVVKVIKTMPPVELPEGFHDEFTVKLKKETTEPIQLITKKKAKDKYHKRKSKSNGISFDLFQFKRYSVIAASLLVTLLVMSSIISIGINVFQDGGVDKEANVPLLTGRVFQASGGVEEKSIASDIVPDLTMESVADEHFVKSFTITIESEDFENALMVVNSLPGYNSDSNIINNQNNRNAHITRRISRDSYSSCKDILRTLGTITSETESEEKITDSIWDSETLLRAKDKELERLFALLEKSNSVNSMVAIEERLSIVESERENVKGVLLANNHKSDNPYLYINIINLNSQVSSIDNSFGDKVKKSFISSFQVCANIMEWILVAFSRVLVPIILLSFVVGSVYFLHHKTQRRDKDV